MSREECKEGEKEEAWWGHKRDRSTCQSRSTAVGMEEIDGGGAWCGTRALGSVTIEIYIYMSPAINHVSLSVCIFFAYMPMYMHVKYMNYSN